MKITRKIFVFVTCIVIVSCKKDSENVTPANSVTAQDVLKKGTTWIYNNTYYDSTGNIIKSGVNYNDTTIVIGDTVFSGSTWFITSISYNGDIYVVNGLGIRNNEYWKFLKGKCSRFDTIVVSPIFKLDIKQNESFQSLYCLTAGAGTEINYSRTLISSKVSVNLADKSYDCMLFKETKIVPDSYTNFEYQYYYYHSVYGLIKNEYYKKTKGGLIYKASETVLHDVKIGI